MRIMCAGGGTLGSVTPLIAIVEELRYRMKRDSVTPPALLWIGTRNGIEKSILQDSAIPFQSIYCGKLRHYFDIRNFIDPFFLCIGMVQSLIAVFRFYPDVIIGAGGYVSVPVIWAGWLLRKRVVVLQLDLVPSLSNLLTSFAACAIFVACEEEKKFFPAQRTRVIGVPVRRTISEYSQKLKDVSERRKMRTHFDIHDDMPILLVMGGGTGAAFLNTLIADCLSQLEGICHIIHSAGKGKKRAPSHANKQYHYYEFLADDLIPALALADVVVTRAGMGSLAELSFLQKACIIIPIPDSHQEQNALYIEKHRGGIYCSQKSITSNMLVEKIQKLFSDTALRQAYATSLGNAFPSDARERVVDAIVSL